MATTYLALVGYDKSNHTFSKSYIVKVENGGVKEACVKLMRKFSTEYLFVGIDIFPMWKMDTKNVFTETKPLCRLIRRGRYLGWTYYSYDTRTYHNIEKDGSLGRGRPTEGY